MKNSFGQSVILTLFGESHGSHIGAVIDGLAPGLPVDEGFIALQLSRRRPCSDIDTARRESDDFSIVSGVFKGKTTGTPICILIPNQDAHSNDYDYGPARPSHADYAAFCKYHGFEDYRGSGHFSGRITAALVAAGGVFIPALKGLGVEIGTHILSCAGVDDIPFSDVSPDISMLQEGFPTLSRQRGEAMESAIARAKAEGDSVGGVTQTAVTGLPAGLGEPWFDSLEGLLSHGIFGIGGIKGIEFGGGFSMSENRGSIVNDAFYLEDGQIKTRSNNSGGINGGISNGMPILFQCAVKPTASIAQAQNTVDFLKNEETALSIRGRHDPAIIRRICPVIDSVSALVLCDLLAQRFGTDVFTKGVD